MGYCVLFRSQEHKVFRSNMLEGSFCTQRARVGSWLHPPTWPPHRAVKPEFVCAIAPRLSLLLPFCKRSNVNSGAAFSLLLPVAYHTKEKHGNVDEQVVGSLLVHEKVACLIFMVLFGNIFYLRNSSNTGYAYLARDRLIHVTK